MAAVITATAAQTIDLPSYHVSGGTERRLKMLVLEGPKAAQNDWFLLTTYEVTAANVITFHAYTEGTGDDTWDLETFTYDPDDAKLVLAHAETGEAYAVVYYFE